MFYSTLQKTEVNPIQLNHINTATQPSYLFAKWLMVDGKLVCKWIDLNL
jgi:hypothetical protein